MLDADWAREFAREWIDAWNAHDMERILSHYADDFEMSSPLIVQRVRGSRGTLMGKQAMRAYWQPSLDARPPLVSELIDVLVGVETVTLYYNNVGRRSVAETLFFDAGRRAVKGISQWSIGAGSSRAARASGGIGNDSDSE